MSQKLLLFTSSFPYGASETFLENELPYLAEAFEKVYIVTLSKANTRREVPSNVTVLSISEDFEQGYTAIKSIKYLDGATLKTFVQEYSKGITKVKSKSDFISYILRVNYKASLLEKLLTKYKIPTNAVFYTYWFEEWATILAILKRKKIALTFHARVHGFDLFLERALNNYIPFRNLQFNQVATVSAVSKAGYNYLVEKHPDFTQKFSLHRLGVQDHGIGSYNSNSPALIVSCSNVVPIKRVHLIVEILSHFKLPVRWVHFGDGNLLQEVQLKASELPQHIRAEFRGRVTNKDIIQFYKENSVELFITTTESEGGSPVSIQEAISFGIPVVGTDVGGVPEIVNNQTGILLPESITAKDIALQIEDFISLKSNNSDFRAGVRGLWEENFKASTNFRKFIADILLNSNPSIESSKFTD